MSHGTLLRVNYFLQIVIIRPLLKKRWVYDILSICLCDYINYGTSHKYHSSGHHPKWQMLVPT
jgi:hypothetical protein